MRLGREVRSIDADAIHNRGAQEITVRIEE